MGGPHVRLEERGIFGVDVVPIFDFHSRFIVPPEAFASTVDILDQR